jgi:hypothetical protein
MHPTPREAWRSPNSPRSSTYEMKHCAQAVHPRNSYGKPDFQGTMRRAADWVDLLIAFAKFASAIRTDFALHGAFIPW